MSPQLTFLTDHSDGIVLGVPKRYDTHSLNTVISKVNSSLTFPNSIPVSLLYPKKIWLTFE